MLGIAGVRLWGRVGFEEGSSSVRGEVGAASRLVPLCRATAVLSSVPTGSQGEEGSPAAQLLRPPAEAGSPPSLATALAL